MFLHIFGLKFYFLEPTCLIVTTHNQQSKTFIKKNIYVYRYKVAAAYMKVKQYILLINDHYQADEYLKNVIILCIYHSCIHIILLWIPNESYNSLSHKL